jgi:hypothetical protein
MRELPPRELPPLTTRYHPIENCIEDAHHVSGARSATRFSNRNQRVEEFLLVYTQVAIVCFFHCSQGSVADCSWTD